MGKAKVKKDFPILDLADVLETINATPNANPSKHRLQIPEQFKASVNAYNVRRAMRLSLEKGFIIPEAPTDLYGYEIMWQGDSVDLIEMIR